MIDYELVERFKNLNTEGTKYLMRLFLLLLFSVVSISLATVVYGESHDIYFHGGINPKTDIAHHGDTLTFYGWSNAYQSWKAGIILTPSSSFDVKIYNPNNEIVFEKSLVSDENGKTEFSIPITDDLEQGKYLVKTTITNEKYVSFYDERYFYVILQESDVLLDSNYALTLSAEQSAKFGSYPKFVAKMCPLPFDIMSDEAFLDPETGAYMDGSQILVNSHITKPDGTKVISPLAYISKPFDCSMESANQFYADMEDKWTIYAVAKWMRNGTIYKTQSNTIEVFVPAPLFRSNQIEMIDVGIPSQHATFGAMDWISGGRYLLLRYPIVEDEGKYYDKFAIYDLEAKTTTELEGLGKFYNEYESISDARFSQSGDGIYFFVYGKKVYFYDIKQKTIAETDTNKVTNFDVDKNGNIFYTKEPENLGESNPEYHLYMLDASSGKTKEIAKHKDFWEFDVNIQGTQVLYRKTVDAGYGWVDRDLTIYDIQTKNHKTIPKIVDADCGSKAIFAPNDDLIIYQITGCGKGWGGGILSVTDINGNSEVLVPASNNRPENPVVSPDGQYLIYTYPADNNGTIGLFKMTLAKPIPEFGAIAALILTVSILSIVVFRRFSRLNL